jgi:hypothetical protein
MNGVQSIEGGLINPVMDQALTALFANPNYAAIVAQGRFCYKLKRTGIAYNVRTEVLFYRNSLYKVNSLLKVYHRFEAIFILYSDLPYFLIPTLTLT